MMSLSLEAASLLGCNDARDVHVQWWNHIDLQRSFTNFTSTSQKAAEKDSPTGPLLQRW